MQVSGRPASPYAPHEEHAAGTTTVAWTVLALIAALVASLGSVALSLEPQTVTIGDQQVSLTKGLQACPLCFYQRSFAFGAFGVLLVGLFTRARRTGAIGVMALPLAIAGLGVAGWHVWLEYDGKLECPKGLQDIGTAPQQSLAALGILTLLLLFDSVRNTSGGWFGGATILLALILGGAFAYGSIKTIGTIPPPPKEAYEKPPTVCRPPNPYLPKEEAQPGS
ncbi:MAG TPA: disulfide bond formation protein B [Gemmataceae bacterium]|nr:disulfide bond formation protein B [Gemmataceae bacterium]